ncbi:hypothetical protein [Niabella aquatica]
MDFIFLKVVGIVFVTSFVPKAYLHYYIAKQHGSDLDISGITTSKDIFWFYKKAVSSKYRGLKTLCNILFAISLVSFVLIFILLNIWGNKKP